VKAQNMQEYHLLRSTLMILLFFTWLYSLKLTIRFSEILMREQAGYKSYARLFGDIVRKER